MTKLVRKTLAESPMTPARKASCPISRSGQIPKSIFRTFRHSKRASGKTLSVIRSIGR